MEISLTFIYFLLLHFVSTFPQEKESSLYLVSHLESHIKEQVQPLVQNDDYSIIFNKNREDDNEGFILDDNTNLPVINVAVQTATHNNSELIIKPREKGMNTEKLYFIDKEILDIKYHNNSIRFDKEIFDQNLQGDIIISYKNLIFTSKSNGLHLYKYFNNFLVEKDIKDLNVQMVSNCSFQGKPMISGNYLLSFQNNLCLYSLEQTDNYLQELSLKSVIVIPNTFQAKSLINFFVFTDTILFVFESSLVVIDYQGNVKVEVKSFNLMSESFNLNINQAYFWEDKLYVLSVSYGILVYSIKNNNSIKLLTKVRSPLASRFKIEEGNLFLVCISNKSMKSYLEIYRINDNQNNLDFITKIIIDYPINNQIKYPDFNLLQYEGFIVIYSIPFKTLHFIENNDLGERSKAILIEKLRLNENEDSYIEGVFTVESDNEKRMGIVLNDNKVLFIKNLKSGERKIDFIFKEYGVYEIKLKVLVQTLKEGLKSLYISTKVNVSNLKEITNIYSESYIYMAFYIMIGILLIGILMVITSSIYNYFENRSQRNIKAGYALTTSKDKSVNSMNEDEKFTLDVELEIKAN